MSTYLVKDINGRTLRTIPNVLDPVALAGVATTSGSNIITVTSTAGVYPGMAIRAPGVPPGCFVQAVQSSTELELWRSTWDTTNGKWTTTAANANATATDSGNTGHALGFDPLCQVALEFAMGMWRNTFRTSGSQTISPTGATGAAVIVTGPGMVTIPKLTMLGSGTSSWVLYPNSDTYVAVSDDFAAIPLKRHNGEFWGIYQLVSTGGVISLVPANPEHAIHYNGADA